MSHTVLVVDDECSVTKSLYRSLRPEGYRVLTAQSGEQALHLMSNQEVDVVITDQKMPSMPGNEFLKVMRQRHPDNVAIMLSGYADFSDVVSAVNEGNLYKYLAKPWNNSELRETVKEAFSLAQKKREDAYNKKIATSSLESLIVTDENFTITLANKFIGQLLKMDIEDLMGMCASDLFENACQWDEITTITEANGHWSGGVELINDKGEKHSVLIKIHPEEQNGQHCGYLIHVQDRAELALMEHNLRELGKYDQESGALTAAEFNDQLEAMLRASPDPEFVALCIVNIPDLRNLKESIGSSVLGHLMFQIKQRLANLSYAGSTTLIGRFSEDKFALAANCLSGDGDVKLFADELAQLFKQSFEIDSNLLPLYPEIGMALYPYEAWNVSELTEAALRTFDSHGAFENSIDVLDPVCRTLKLSSKFLLEKELNKAIAEKHFELVYQPQFNITNSEAMGVETLIRWNHPDYGHIKPDLFIPHAEQANLISSIDKWVITQAIAQLSEWQSKGLSLALSVNVSALNISDPKFVNWIANLIDTMDIPRKNLSIEITETALLDLKPESEAGLRRIREQGVSIVLDDFGKGYSALSRLWEIPIDGIKIDRSFMLNAERCRKKQAVIESLASIARKMDIKLIAEGVENDAQLNILRDCPGDQTYVQSFIYAEPLSAEAISKFFN